MNLRQLAKDDLVYMATTRCKHRHLLIEHPQCYKRKPERLGFLDIESSNLDADFGIVLSYCIKRYNGSIIANLITQEELRSVMDYLVSLSLAKPAGW